MKKLLAKLSLFAPRRGQDDKPHSKEEEGEEEKGGL